MSGFAAAAERGDDVLHLAENFIARFAQEYQQAPRSLHPDNISAFLRYSWPGNVRELENLIHRQFLVSDDPLIRFSLDELKPVYDRRKAERSPSRITLGDFQTAKARAIAQFEKSYLSSLLSETHGNVSLAADLSGKERSALGKLIKNTDSPGRSSSVYPNLLSNRLIYKSCHRR